MYEAMAQGATPAMADRPAAGFRAAGSDAPELPVLRVGFVPLVDCVPLILARVLRLDERHGVRFVLSRESSWAAVRDKLLAGALDLAQALYGLVYGVELGIGGPRQAMAVLMTLNRNGQGISLSRRLADDGVRDLASFALRVRAGARRHRLAQTFPTGTHALWLYHALASVGVHPLRDVDAVTLPPMQMVDAVRCGEIDGFSVGAPWNQIGIREGVSVHVASSQDVWPDHPEKVLAGRAGFADRNPNACRAAVAAVLEASRWLDASAENRLAAAQIVADADYVDAPVEAIAGRLLGRYEDGLGRHWIDPHPMCFFDGGAVSFPYLSDAMWFMTQHKRWGLLATHPDYAAVAARVQRIELYREAAACAGVALPASPMRASRLLDGTRWNGASPREYADSFALHGGARPPAAADPAIPSACHPSRSPR